MERKHQKQKDAGQWLRFNSTVRKYVFDQNIDFTINLFVFFYYNYYILFYLFSISGLFSLDYSSRDTLWKNHKLLIKSKLNNNIEH